MLRTLPRPSGFGVFGAQQRGKRCGSGGLAATIAGMPASCLEFADFDRPRLRFPMVKPGKVQKRAARSQRLSAALRENLKRRKAQARGRAADKAAEGGSGNDSGTKAPDFRRNQGNE